jgi:hypothetical protein
MSGKMSRRQLVADIFLELNEELEKISSNDVTKKRSSRSLLKMSRRQQEDFFIDLKKRS